MASRMLAQETAIGMTLATRSSFALSIEIRVEFSGPDLTKVQATSHAGTLCYWRTTVDDPSFHIFLLQQGNMLRPYEYVKIDKVLP